ncbi:menaquinone biosynthesis protein [Simkania negevensis]|uniref:Chorismate dehydratase n=1 Tax=Simkania negevensis TaxID=83561 RepID=A0ABS3AVD9_9BACT|nr:menaquinone biosynthesis protein [Simkania negevensis]
MLKIGIVQYTNAIPFLLPLQNGAVAFKADWTIAPPSRLNSLLREGLLDCALISSYEYLIHGKLYRPLFPSYGIYATGAVQSVLFFHTTPLDDLPQLVTLTSESASSSALLKILCHHYWKQSPSFTSFQTLDEALLHPAFLVIGDDALMLHNKTAIPSTDLAEAWTKATGLPFVFALFCARADLPKDKEAGIREFGDALEATIAWSQNNMAAVISQAERTLSLPRVNIEEYYSCLSYLLDQQAEQGLNKFETLTKSTPYASKL